MFLIRELGKEIEAGRLDELTLTTNGSQLSKFAAELVDCGVRRINVSLDTLDPDKFRQITRWGELTKVLEGIDAALAAGLKVKINAVALKDFNDAEIPELMRWAHGRGMRGLLTTLMVVVIAYRLGAFRPIRTILRPAILLRIAMEALASVTYISALGQIPLANASAIMSKNRLWGWLAYAYVYFFRGTPLITQLFLIYYGLGSFRPQLETVGLWWFFRDAWNCALFTFTLNTAAYQAEILRGAIESVPRGQREGAAALGLPDRIAFFKVILPQAMIVALRPYGNEIILMIKGSAIVAIVTVFDLMATYWNRFAPTVANAAIATAKAMSSWRNAASPIRRLAPPKE